MLIKDDIGRQNNFVVKSIKFTKDSIDITFVRDDGFEVSKSFRAFNRDDDIPDVIVTRQLHALETFLSVFIDKDKLNQFRQELIDNQERNFRTYQKIFKKYLQDADRNVKVSIKLRQDPTGNGYIIPDEKDFIKVVSYG